MSESFAYMSEIQYKTRMVKVGFLADDKKLGALAEQRDRIGPVFCEMLPEDHDALFDDTFVREGDTLVVAHARALGRFRSGFALRDDRLQRLSAMNIKVQIGADGIAELYAEAEKRAAFHAAALEPTGIATPKQKKNAGRPKTYRKPQGELMDMAREWWAGRLHTDDVGKLIGQAMGTKAVSRATLNAWLGPRPKCKGRDRKTHSDKKR